MVAKNRSRDYNLVMHVVNAPPTLPKQRRAGTKRKEWLIIEKRRWPSFQHMYLPCQLHSHSTFHALIKSALPHSMQNHGHYLSVLQSDPLSGRHWWLPLWAEALCEGAKVSSPTTGGIGLDCNYWLSPPLCLPTSNVDRQRMFFRKIGEWRYRLSWYQN